MKKIIAIALALMLCVGAMSVVAFAAEGSVTIYAQMPEGSATPNLWAWNGSENAFDTWPGQAMTLNGDYYEIEVPNWVTGMIINTDGDNDKSADITVEAGKDVWLVCTVGDDGKLVAEVYYEDPANGGEAVVPETPEQPEDTTPDAPAADATYIVAGSEALCGVDWDPAAEANKMTKGSDGIYTKTYSNVAAGSYSVKVTDGSWTNSWGGDGENGNYDFTVTEAGDVTVKFDASAQKVTVTVNGEPAQTGDMSLAGVSVALLAATAGLVAIVSKKED